MNPRPWFAPLLCALAAPCWAQSAPTQAIAVQPPLAERAEPNVREIVVEDKGSRIEELRVRGQTVRMVVTPKVGLTQSYEIIVSHGGRPPEDSTGGASSAVGKRVWNVLSF